LPDDADAPRALRFRWPRSRRRSAGRDEFLAGPIRGELLGSDQLATKARTLAAGQRLRPPSRARREAPLLARLTQTRRILHDIHARLAAGTAREVDVGPAGDWLLENFHVVLEHIREVQETLPRGYYRELPELASGTLEGYPRIYELAITLISHSEARVDINNLELFVAAFQEKATLAIGELWAIPAMLRLALIESVRRMALRTVQRMDEVEQADAWAARIEAAAASDGALGAMLDRFVDAPPRLSPVFISRFLRQLRQSRDASSPLAHIEQWISDRALSAEDAAARSTQHLALTQVIMAHSITSLRAITHIDWPTFVEGQSVMESALGEDPSGYYRRMTFPTRDRYRHVAERIARRTGLPEAEVARAAVDLARAAAGEPASTTCYRAHVGYWLIDDGLDALEAATGYRPGPVAAVHRWVLRHPDLVLGGGIVAGTVAALGALLALAGWEARAAMLVVLVVAFLPALDLAIAVVNQLVTVFLPPRRLPALDLRAKGGIPEQFRTAVVVPTLFDSVDAVHDALDHLEVQFLANRHPHLHFAVLSDFTDAAAETCAEDDEIMAAAVERVRSLNDQYAAGGQDAFYLLHRPRRWNPSQGVWMGWERKRGKLAEFNRFLRGADGAFMTVVGNVEPLRRVRYVITLDSDTVLPPAAAAQLIGAIAHPLNRAVYDPVRGRVVRGYGILQPRVGVSLPSAHASRFAAIHSGHPGVDPYTTAVSDVYQDLYGEGSFTGKGIYDVDAFENATHGRFPENTLLSHDLIEGSYARAGLATDINVYDDYPKQYLTYTRRKHRWIRGDWQLLEWLTPHVPGPDGPERNRLRALSRWKIIDNLRRSTVEIAQLAFLVAGWTVLPGSPLRWTALGLAAIAGPWIASLVLAVVRPPLDKSWRAYYWAVGRDAATSAQQIGLAVTFLPHQAFVSADAIVRTLWRLLISRRHLLEWQTASHAETLAATATGGAWRAMWPAVAMAPVVVAVAGVQILGGAAVLPLAGAVLPLAGLWALSPVIAQALGAPARAKGRLMTAEDRNEAIRYARAHWRYFAEFVTADTHWLVPDNFQEDPTPVVAMRTSPTNIGLQLLAIASARDLGFIDTEDMTGRLERAFQSLERMRRYRGHFFNWYDLTNLEVLEPAYVSTVDSGNLAGHLLALRHACLDGAPTGALQTRLEALADRAGRYVAEMDFRFLFDEERELFSIGFHYGTRTLDSSFYDLLASEARLASFVAIAKGDAPVEHWFRLGRTLTHAAGETALVSWSGSMFEYLMPGLVMRSFPATLLDLTSGGAVRRQIAYGREQGLPWGVSESAYNVRDRHLTYQYRAFGVPDLALKRGLDRDLVIAPYASLLAIAVDPPHAMGNLAALEAKGALGRYGFRDALDYTRPDPGKRYVVVGTYMAHHVGMGLVALTNGLLGNVWQERFHADALVRGAELLLYERIPRRLVLQETQETRAGEALPDPEAEGPVVREFDRPDTPHPHVALLGRHPYTVMLTHSGSGYSRFEDMAVTRWRDDPTRDATGQYCYLKDVDSGRRWSTAHQPVRARADWYRALLATDRVTFHRSDDRIETRTEIAVVPEDAAEVRSVTVTNHGAEPREIELTSYGEIVLGPADADRAHPAFSSLFVETEWHEWCSAITATRRPRSAGEPTHWCVHVVAAGSHRVGPVTCETDRARFIGRGGTTRAPAAMRTDGPLSGTTGAVLDPIFALRTRVRLEPHQSASVSFTTLVAPTRERAFELADRYHAPHAAQRALDLAWTSQQAELRELDLKPADAVVFQEFAGFVLHPRAELRPPPAELAEGHGAQDLLWSAGISGDEPIVLATIDSVEGLSTLRRILVAHHYLRRRGLTIDLVVLLTQPSSYLQELRDRITETMVAANDAEVDRPGGVFVRAADQLPPDVRRMLGATARVTMHCDGRALGRILEAVGRGEEAEPTDADVGRTRPRGLEQRPPPASPAGRRVHAHPGSGAGPEGPARTAPARRASPASTPGSAPHEGAPLLFDNGFGGLTPDGDYQIRLRGGSVPPAPWANVVANARGGFLVSERGAGCTWAGSSYFFRLTPWHNDPVSDPVSEVIYLRDAASGDLWSPTPAPLDGGAMCTVRHGAGFSTFESERHGIATRLTLAMAGEESVKVSALRLTNRSEHARRLELTAYMEWTLGVTREQTRHHVHTQYDEALGAILARNAFDSGFADTVAFCAISEAPIDHTADRREFLGRNGSVDDPAGLRGGPLREATGSGLDPCAALRCVLDLEPGETRELVVLLGAAHGRDEARRTIARLRREGAAAAAAAGSVERWRERLSVVTVRTPEPAFDAMLNRWMLYQALSCRMWARSALYQSSGAFGFRDQLQDVLAFLYAEPGVAREHILRAAARQFVEGDVQHWWHPQSGRGVRTRFSDDLAWLPWAVDRYVSVTGDASVLQEYVPFLAMRQLEPHEHDVYDLPQTTDEHGSVYEHCLRALRKACTRGPHGLPLIGSGDWNDGMSRVGIEGRGESVWLAWFLIATLRAFAVRADDMGDANVATDFRSRADAYLAAVETHGWDGEWYRRAWFDDGTPLGSSGSDECRIDSIAQSWSVISGAGRPDRQARAMRSVEEHLVREADRLIVLLTPPFDEMAADPGYIKGYLPGVRENGAQYTHAALWTVLATALRGDGDRAFHLFQMLNPLTRSATPIDVETYKVEPYVVAADVYTAPGLVGRGGWTWYTGSASWMYRVGLETILGFTRRGDTLRIDPRVPAHWPEFGIEYRFGAALYSITVLRPGELQAGESVVSLDGRILPDATIPLVDDGQRHRVVVNAAPPPDPG
jgi:cyclic beta-1,2-glucan synthetase